MWAAAYGLWLGGHSSVPAPVRLEQEVSPLDSPCTSRSTSDTSSWPARLTLALCWHGGRRVLPVLELCASSSAVWCSRLLRRERAFFLGCCSCRCQDFTSLALPLPRLNDGAREPPTLPPPTLPPSLAPSPSPSPVPRFHLSRQRVVGGVAEAGFGRGRVPAHGWSGGIRPLWVWAGATCATHGRPQPRRRRRPGACAPTLAKRTAQHVLQNRVVNAAAIERVVPRARAVSGKRVGGARVAFTTQQRIHDSVLERGGIELGA